MQLFISKYLSALLYPQMLASASKSSEALVNINRNTSRFLKKFEGVLTAAGAQSPSATTASRHRSLIAQSPPAINKE